MKLQINENYRIETDPLNIALYKKTGKKKTIWSIQGYYSNFESLFKALMTCKILEIDLEDIKTIRDIMAFYYEDIKKCFSDCKWDNKKEYK
jgi:hypothetical protein